MSHKPGSQGLWQIVNSVLKKGKSTVAPLLNSLKKFSSDSDKAKCLLKLF